MYGQRHQGVANFASNDYGRLIASSQAEPDLAKRRQVYLQLNDLFLDECFVMTIAQQPVYMAARSNVRGIRSRINQDPVFSDMWCCASSTYHWAIPPSTPPAAV